MFIVSYTDSFTDNLHREVYGDWMSHVTTTVNFFETLETAMLYSNYKDFVLYEARRLTDEEVRDIKVKIEQEKTAKAAEELRDKELAELRRLFEKYGSPANSGGVANHE